MCECLDYSDGSRYQCPVCADMSRAVEERLVAAKELVTLQADDARLWLVQRPVKESEVAHLQESLRAVHKEVEGGLNNPLLNNKPF